MIRHSQSDKASELRWSNLLSPNCAANGLQSWVTTTNDNLNALRFYQRRGFRITRVRPGVVNEARHINPVVGEYGILIRDEIDLERRVDI
jgi:ribosomal protein S18 acetylase RimI-like enzyme